MSKKILVLGMFVADLAFEVDRIPAEGETLLANRVTLGPGGKGSNQAVAAAKVGGDITFLSRVGDDAFANMMADVHTEAGIDHQHVVRDKSSSTGAASIAISKATGNNSIVVAPGPAGNIGQADLDTWTPLFERSHIFVTQLETNLDATFAAVRKAKELGLHTVLNPAPAFSLPEDLYPCCDLLTPNEVEAGQLLNTEVKTVEQAIQAAEAFISLGVKQVCLTLGDQGVVVHDGTEINHLPAFMTGLDSVDTSGAGDCFTGCLATRIAAGDNLLDAAQFANKAASLSVTKLGTAASMPTLKDVTSL
ncbi:MAG: ribokinase [Alphaproteobacteria bacterium]